MESCNALKNNEYTLFFARRRIWLLRDALEFKLDASEFKFGGPEFLRDAVCEKRGCEEEKNIGLQAENFTPNCQCRALKEEGSGARLTI